MTTRAGEIERTSDAARADAVAPHDADAPRALPPRFVRPSEVGESHAERTVDEEPPPLTFAGWAAETLRRWRVVRRCALLGLGIAALALFVLPPIYRSEATFATQSAGGMRLPSGAGSGALAALASQFGVSPGGADASESPDFYVRLIQSRELLTRLAGTRVPDPRTDTRTDSVPLVDVLLDSVSMGERLGFRPRDPQRRLQTAVRVLDEDVLLVTADTKTGMVSVRVETPYPDVSRATANETVRLVGAYNVEQRITKAKQRRAFSEERLAAAQAELLLAESRLRDFYQQNRRWSASPSLTFEEGRLRRQVEIATDTYMTLRREFETARIAEVNDAAVISVVDSAVSARRPVRPRPVAMLFTTTLVGALLGLLLAGLLAIWSDWGARDTTSASRLRAAWARARSEALPSFRRRRASAR